MTSRLWRDKERENKGEQLEAGEIGKDWGRVRPPWLGQGSVGTCEQIERVLYFGWQWDPEDLADITVAVKGDKAGINLGLWAVGGDGPGLEEAREVIRNLLWRVWLRNICREAQEWLRLKGGVDEAKEKNKQAIQDCISRCTNSTWWNWDHGSRLLFWRWPDLWQAEARDGAPGFHFKQPRPQLKFPQVPITEEWIVEKDKEKLEKLLRRGYIANGYCRNTVPRFPVPKGDDDIRVVWDLSKNGVNETMYTPTFFLATMSTYLRRINSGTFGGDFDVGKQFHNYVLHEHEQQYCGVEVPTELIEKLCNEGYSVHKLMRWTRLVFGWQSSPYMALRMFAQVIELAKGEPEDKSSAFAWDQVVLNLPGSREYNPAKPRVMKLAPDGHMSADIVTFYDDGRVFGETEVKAEHAIRQITSRIQYFRNQDAARKRRPVSQRPGAWAGGVAYTDQNVLRTFITPPKWERVKAFLDWVWDGIQAGKGLDRKQFRSGKGFLVYVSMVYEFMGPYMKGFHLSEDAWRKDRDPEGWKETLEPWLGDTDVNTDYDIALEQQCTDDAPPLVVPVMRLEEDVRILRTFFGLSSPIQIIARPVEGSSLVVYGGGDASGEGFGGQLQPAGAKPMLRRGFWCPGDADNSSNWRELRNLIDTLIVDVNAGRLAGREVWLATDNSTAAFAYYRGTSGSKKLHEMVTELRMLTLRGNFVLHIYHIAGTRMIESGIDALSRGELHVAALEKSLTTLMPLHLSPLTRSPSLYDWLAGWMGDSLRVATPRDWFYNAQQAGEYTINKEPTHWVWDLPPAAALQALEELGNGRLKRHELLTGVVLVPTLLTAEWFRRFTRTVDMYFVVPAGSVNHGIGNEYHSWYHWEGRCQRCTSLVTHRRGIFCANFGDQAPGLPSCQSAWCGPCYKILPGEDFSVFRPVDEDGEELCAPGEEKDFKEGRPGDHLFCPFECDKCVFYRIRGHQPTKGMAADEKLLIYIRRANLDAFWSRRPGTVYALNNIFAEQVQVGQNFGFSMFDSPGPFSRRYDSGMKAAVGILWRSQRPGLHEAKMKFSSVRKARSLHTDFFNSSAQGVEGAIVWRSERARFVTTKAPTDSCWFNAFMTGYKARVGERRKQDAAIPIAVMVALQDSLEEEWNEATANNNQKEQRRLAEHGAFYLFLFCGSLRGFEGPKVVLTDLRKQIVSPGTSQAELYGAHVGLPLAGRFKARTQDARNILIPIAYETKSKLKPGLWAERLVHTLQVAEVTNGWAFQDSNGDQLKMSHFEEDFYERLSHLHYRQPNLFTEGVVVIEDYHLTRSFRRGATTRATAAGVSAEDIDYINRWNIGTEGAGSGPMRVLYADRIQLTKVFLRFSLAL